MLGSRQVILRLGTTCLICSITELRPDVVAGISSGVADRRTFVDNGRVLPQRLGHAGGAGRDGQIGESVKTLRGSLHLKPAKLGDKGARCGLRYLGCAGFSFGSSRYASALSASARSLLPLRLHTSARYRYSEASVGRRRIASL